MTRLFNVVVAAMLLCGGGCTSRESIFATPAPTPIRPSPPAPPTARLIGLRFDRGGVNGGETSRGTVTLDLPTPVAETVTLSSGDPAVSVPATVVVPAGSASATFTALTSVVSRDVEAPVTVSLRTVTVNGALSVWADLPVSFSWTSDADDVLGRGGFGRLTPDTASFEARCERSEIRVFVKET